MNRIFAFGLSVVFGSSLHAQTINLRGVVSNGSGQPVAKAVVELVKLGIRDTTGSDGAFSINKAVLSNRSLSATRTERESIKLDKGVLEFTLDKPSPVKIEVFDVKGNLLSKDLLPKAQPGTYHLNIDLNIATNIASDAHSDKILIVQASIGPLVRSFRYFPSQHVISEGDFTIASPRSAGGMLAKLAAAVDTLNISAVGYTPKKIGLSAYDTTVNVTLSDATTVYNPCPTNGSPCKILPFGDSITEGVKSSDGGGYRSQLFKLIVAANQKVTFVGSLSAGPTTVSGQSFPRNHEGHSGWTIAPGFSEFGSGGIASLVPSPALNGAPHMILLHIGANDVFPSGKDMAARLEALIDKIAQNAPNALIVLAQHTPIGTTNGGHTAAQVAAANAAQQLYNSMMPGIIQAHNAKGQHLIGVDMSKMPLSDLTPSSMHPNPQGYAYMGDVWYAGIKDLLPK